MSNVNVPQHTVSLYRIIGNVVGDLGLGNINQHLDNMARWAVDAVLLIGSRNSTERVECELDVKDRRACLPMGFEYEHAFNFGGHIIDVSKRDFQMFNKAPRTVDLSEEKFNHGELIIVTAGVKLSMRITFGGVFSVGSTIVVTLAMVKCGNAETHVFTYVVLGGDTLVSIAAQFATQMNAIDIGVTATASFGYVEILADHVDTTFTISTYTTAAMGTMTVTTTQKHQAPKNMDKKVDNCEVDIKEGSSNLATVEATLLNRGNFMSNGGFGDVMGLSDAGAWKYTISNGYAYFNFIENGKIGISYQRVMLDHDGWPLIFKGHELAVTQYCKYMYYQGQAANQKVTMSFYKDMEQRWFYLCGQARGDDEMPTKKEMEYAADMWNQMLPLPNKNNF